MSSWRGWLAAMALVGAAEPCAADQFEEAQSWLERMAVAMRERSYEGTFVYVRGEDVETIRLTHVLENGVVQERLVTLSGPPREVVRDASGLRAVNGGRDAALPANALLPDFPVDALERARDRYLFEIGGESRIAGHRGRQVTITPRDQYRYGYELWLDDDTSLLLRWIVYDPDRRPLAKLMFTDLVIGADDATGLAAAAETEGSTANSPGTTEAGDGSTTAEDIAVERLPLPPGFVLAARLQTPPPSAADHLVFSDGLASVSVYLESFQAETGLPEGLSRFGTTNAWSQRVGDRRITVLGEVPMITLKAFGTAFRRLERTD